MFCIDARPSTIEDVGDGSNLEHPQYRSLLEQAEESDSSDCEVPTFSLSSFKKFDTAPVRSTSNPWGKQFEDKLQLCSSLNAGKDYNKSNYIYMATYKRSAGDATDQQKEKMQKILDKHLEKSIVCQPEFEKLEKVPPILSLFQQRKEGLKLRDKTKGYDWYNMAAPEMTEEKKNDLLVVQMRQALDPKHFYKRSATKTAPKYFQVGTFVDNPIDFYSSRIPKKQRKQTLVDELLADAEFRQYQKKKFNEIQQAQPPKYVHRKKLSHRRRNEAKEAQASKKSKGASKKSKKGKKKA